MTAQKLQNEAKNHAPFDTLEQKAMLNLLRTHDQYHNRFGRLFRQFDLTSSQYHILQILQGEGKPMKSLDVAARMIQVVPAITGLIDRLEEAQLVERKRSIKDRRVVHIQLTEKAERLFAAMEEPVNELHKQLIGHLNKSELQELNRLLEKARASLQSGD